ncbi:unnamed protein product [Periconia digitata]|uniref:Uncharacterized protein n=1 Tax=Periconia digitata TaxID=1303443 RepID=A0A9W4U291_9PLEO|nr:unnamed protein product [Periconia digitata]
MCACITYVGTQAPPPPLNPSIPCRKANLHAIGTQAHPSPPCFLFLLRGLCGERSRREPGFWLFPFLLIVAIASAESLKF